MGECLPVPAHYRRGTERGGSARVSQESVEEGLSAVELERKG